MSLTRRQSNAAVAQGGKDEILSATAAPTIKAARADDNSTDAPTTPSFFVKYRTYIYSAIVSAVVALVVVLLLYLTGVLSSTATRAIESAASAAGEAINT